MNRKIFIAAVSFVIATVLLVTPCFAFAGSTENDGIKLATYTFSDNGIYTQLSDEDGNAMPMSTVESASTRKVPNVQAVSLPASYSLKDANRVTSVKSQGSNGNCWAYSALASLESNYISKGYGTIYDTDFSESHLTWFTYHSYVSDNTSSVYGDGYTQPLKGKTSFSMGGNFMLAAYTLASGMGVASENSYPYVGTSVAYSAADRYSQTAMLSEMERYVEYDLDSIKQALMNDGAISLDFCYKGDAYCVNSSYYYSGSTKSQSNHAVTLVGWDDNYSRENFSSSMRPSKDGAWLCKNSWGASDALMKNGYFWISYSDPSLCDFASFTCEKAGSYENIYQYDGFGYGSSLYSNSCNTAYVANVFTAEANEFLDSISFYTDQFNVDYTVYIYNNMKSDYALPTDGTLAGTVSGNEAYPGYHRVDMGKLIKIEDGTNFSVVIKMTAKNDKAVYVPVEGTSIPAYNVYYSSNARNSYVRFPDDATQSNWFDSHNNTTNNVPVKAFTVDEHECEFGAQLVNTEHGNYITNTCSLCGDNFVSIVDIADNSDMTFTLKNKSLGIDVIVPAAPFVGKAVSLYAVRDTEYNAARVVDSADGYYTSGSLYYIALVVDGNIVTNPGCALDVKIAAPSDSLECYSLYGNRGAYTSFEKSDASYSNGTYVFSKASCGGFLLCSVNHSSPVNDEKSDVGETGGSVATDNNDVPASSNSGSFFDKITEFFNKIAEFFRNLFS